MKLIFLIVMSLIWLGTLVPACGVLFATMMAMDNGGIDKLKDALVWIAILCSGAYFVIVPLSLIVAWIAFFTETYNVTHVAILCPLVNIAVLAFSLMGSFIRYDIVSEKYNYKQDKSSD